MTWIINDAMGLLAAGRRRQLGVAGQSPEQEQDIRYMSATGRVGHSTAWDIPPHAAFLLPFATRSERMDKDAYALFCDVLLLLTALDGGESVLDSLAESGSGPLPLRERWDWRSRLHLPNRSWDEIDRVIRWSMGGTAGSDLRMEACGKELLDSLEEMHVEEIGIADFLLERVDLGVDGVGLDEIARTVRRGVAMRANVPASLNVDSATLDPRMNVRLGQVAFEAKNPVDTRLTVPRDEADRVMKQIVSAFESPNYADFEKTPQLVVLPELSVPREEVGTLREHVRGTGRAAVAGIYWQVARTVYPAGNAVRVGQQWFLNEAELTIPVGHQERGPTGVKWYRVLKPVPSHFEQGLANALSKTTGYRWRILEGRRWYRFVHRKWGDFSVAICSDLIDSTPWSALRGEILHLFVVAYNRDVELYEALTWSRAYENYVNLVMVNSGRYGGSTAWTPKRKHEREIARIRGNDLMVIADVTIPAGELLKKQIVGIEESIERAKSGWLNLREPVAEFKSPPPDYRRRAIKQGTSSGDEEEQKET